MTKDSATIGNQIHLSKHVDNYRRYFSDRFVQSGDNVKTLWGSIESQTVRFKVLTEIANLEAASILDVGSGFGDLFGYLQHRQISFKRYLGLEITPEIINVARERFPQATFKAIDITTESLDSSFDYAFASGIFFLNSENWQEYFLSMLEKLSSSSSKAFGFNLLSVHSKNREPESYYCDPGDTLNLVMQKICKRAVLRHDYRENDFTIYCYK